MWRATWAVAAVGLTCAGACGGPAREPAARYGRMTALLGDAPVVGAWGPDSVVAVYASHSGTLQIEGGRMGADRRPIVRVMMSCAAAPRPGVYPVAGMRTPVHAEAYLHPPGVGGWWSRFVTRWPRVGAPWPRAGALRAFLSDSTPPGVLELDTLDLAGGRVYGRFWAAVRSYNRVPTESLAVSGTFWGRVRTVDLSGWPGGRTRRAPGFDRDCAAVRRPLPAATAVRAGLATTNHVGFPLTASPGRPGAAGGSGAPRRSRASKARS